MINVMLEAAGGCAIRRMKQGEVSVTVAAVKVAWSCGVTLLDSDRRINGRIKVGGQLVTLFLRRRFMYIFLQQYSFWFSFLIVAIE